MDILERAAIFRASEALRTIVDTRSSERAKAFVETAFLIAKAGPQADIRQRMAASSNPIVQKASAQFLGDAVWVAPEAAALAKAYVSSIAEGSLLDSILKYAISLPQTLAHVVFASGSAAGIVAEGGVKVVQRVPQSLVTAQVLKAAALIVMSAELARIPAAQALFERELGESVTRAANTEVVNALLSTSTTHIGTSGDALTDLRAGLRASVPSTAYVVAVSTKDAADLATRTENKGGAGVRGGVFVPGVDLVVMDDLTGLVVIPASRIAIEDGGLRVSASEQASVNMSASPTEPSTLVSLFSTNCVGLLCERQFRIATDSNVVTVGGP